MSKPTQVEEEVIAEEVEEVVETEAEAEKVVEVEEESDSIDLNEVRSAMGLKPKEPKEVELEKESDTEAEEEKPIQPDYVVKFLEEFEGKHNKEIVKPKDIDDLRTNFQKGLNYDKQHTELDSYKAKVKKLESLIGIDLDKAIEQVEANNAKEQIDEYAEKHNVTAEEAKELIEKDKRIKDLEFKNRVRDFKDTAGVKKKELANKLYFKELESDIDDLIQENIDNGKMIDVETAYRYLLGAKAEELIKSNKKDTEKRTLANVQDRAKRTVQKDATADNSTVVLSAEAKHMASEMGVSLSNLKKRMANKNRRK